MITPLGTSYQPAPPVPPPAGDSLEQFQHIMVTKFSVLQQVTSAAMNPQGFQGPMENYMGEERDFLHSIYLEWYPRKFQLDYLYEKLEAENCTSRGTRMKLARHIKVTNFHRYNNRIHVYSHLVTDTLDLSY